MNLNNTVALNLIEAKLADLNDWRRLDGRVEGRIYR